MSLKYNVAIIDDQIQFFEFYKEIIEEHLSANGFYAEVDHISSEKNFESYPISMPNMYMIDLKFGNDDKGQNFIRKIREQQLTDILFYSSDHEAIENYKLEFGSQGIFFAEKEEQNDEVIVILEKMLDKMISTCNTPRTTRGLIMECVAELDDIIKEKIMLLYSKLTDEQIISYRKRILEKIKNSYDGRLNDLKRFFDQDFANKIENASVINSDNGFLIEDLIEEIKITDSSKNLSFLLSLYKILFSKDDLYKDIAKYQELLSKRNILAHVSQSMEGDKIVFKNKDYIYTLSDEECLSLRTNILSLTAAIKSIH